jgi:F-type H+-transporting ATPase subunit epsilon
VRLKVILPEEVFLEEEASKVIAEAGNGSFCIEPRHVDFLAALAPGILTFVSAEDGGENHLAVDEGLLLKCGPEVAVSTRHAIRGPGLEALRRNVAERFERLDAHERKARSALARIEADLARRFFMYGKQGV